MHELFAPQSLIALLTLTALEIVLGVDNVVFIAVLTNKLPEHRQRAARFVGLLLAALGRIVLLVGITWIITLEKIVLFEVMEYIITPRDLILIAGGVFLLGKATWEIHESLEVGHQPSKAAKVVASFAVVLMQIVLLDLVFSIDSVLTAVGMVEPELYEHGWVPLTIMVTAIVIAIAIMLLFAGRLARFIDRHPTFKMLALAFLLLIGIILVAEGLHQHIPRGYIYFAMGFSLFVEILNVKFTAKRRGQGPGAAEKKANAHA